MSHRSHKLPERSKLLSPPAHGGSSEPSKWGNVEPSPSHDVSSEASNLANVEPPSPDGPSGLSTRAKQAAATKAVAAKPAVKVATSVTATAAEKPKVKK